MSMRTAEFSCLDIAPVHLHVYIYAFLFVCMYAHIFIPTANFLCSISELFSSCCAVYIDVHMYVCMPAYLNSHCQLFLPQYLSVAVAVALFILTYICIYLRKYVCMHAYLNTLPTSFASTSLLSWNCLACAC